MGTNPVWLTKCPPHPGGQISEPDSRSNLVDVPRVATCFVNLGDTAGSALGRRGHCGVAAKPRQAFRQHTRQQQLAATVPVHPKMAVGDRTVPLMETEEKQR